MPLNKMDLIHSFKAMMTVANLYDVPVKPEFEEMDEQLLEEYDLNVYDMMGSLEHVYNELKEQK